jgi:hypothetical protein
LAVTDKAVSVVGYGTVIGWLLLSVPVPLLIGIGAASFLPGVGDFRDHVTPWSLLHLLWILVATWVIEIVAKAVGRAVSILSGHEVPSAVFPMVEWIALTLLFGVYFPSPVGAAVAAAVSVGLEALFSVFIERREECEAAEKGKA